MTRAEWLEHVRKLADAYYTMERAEDAGIGDYIGPSDHDALQKLDEDFADWLINGADHK